MLKDPISLKGKLEIFVNGTLVQTVDNLVVTAGKQFVASRVVGVADAVMSHMAIGTGSTAAVVGDTTLGTEVARVALTSGIQTGAAAIYTATFLAGTGTGAITEAGLFNAGSSGTMLARTVFSVINKGALDALVVTWTVTVS